MHFNAILSHFIAYNGRWSLLKRGGHPLLLLPSSRRAAIRTLDLFQPQRIKARVMIAGVRAISSLGLHRQIFPSVRHHGAQVMMEPSLPLIIDGTCGFLFGSPDHQIQRAIACYETSDGWEVAKIAFGEKGREMLVREAESLNEIGGMTSAAPHCLGLHSSEEATVLRMPYLAGHKIRPGESWDMLGMLDKWLSIQSPKSINAFPEWNAISRALEANSGGDCAITRLKAKMLRPCIRHGDFTRWNVLRKPTGEIMVIDWEWGHPQGMPGLDLVHYLAQDARLVKRLPPHQVLEETRRELMQAPVMVYLNKSGWGDDLDALILAAIAYPVGANHQENDEVLRIAIANCVK